jgi:hypothetical protein
VTQTHSRSSVKCGLLINCINQLRVSTIKYLRQIAYEERRGWWCGSSCRVVAQQVRGFQFKLQYCRKEGREGKRRKGGREGGREVVLAHDSGGSSPRSGWPHCSGPLARAAGEVGNHVYHRPGIKEERAPSRIHPHDPRTSP